MDPENCLPLPAAVLNVTASTVCFPHYHSQVVLQRGYLRQRVQAHIAQRLWIMVHRHLETWVSQNRQLPGD
jgi:hypothetical protein